MSVRMGERIAYFTSQGADDAWEAYDPREGEPPTVDELAADYLAYGTGLDGETDALPTTLAVYAQAWAEGWRKTAMRRYEAYEEEAAADA